MICVLHVAVDGLMCSRDASLCAHCRSKLLEELAAHARTVALRSVGQAPCPHEKVALRTQQSGGEAQWTTRDDVRGPLMLVNVWQGIL